MAECYRHPGVETGVSCSSCGRPICPDCMTPTPVEAAPVQVESDLKVLARRGIRLASRDGPCLSISFANAVREVTLELVNTPIGIAEEATDIDLRLPTRNPD